MLLKSILPTKKDQNSHFLIIILNLMIFSQTIILVSEIMFNLKSKPSLNISFGVYNFFFKRGLDIVWRIWEMIAYINKKSLTCHIRLFMLCHEISPCMPWTSSSCYIRLVKLLASSLLILPSVLLCEKHIPPGTSSSTLPYPFLSG